MIPLAEVQRRQQLVEESCRRARLKVRTHDPHLSLLEGVLARGDSSLAPLLERAVDQGARFDGWSDRFRREIWEPLLAEVDLEHQLGAIAPGARLPWDHVDSGITGEFIAREREQADRGQTTAPCGSYRAADRDEPDFVCHACGLACRAEDLPLLPRRVPGARERQSISVRSASDPAGSPVVDRAGSEIRVRLTMAKTGRQAFVGHLDTVHQLGRILRRAGLDQAYTRGFHPKGRIEPGPALPLGTAGLAEPVDVWLLDPPPADEILERIVAAAPPELTFSQVQIMGDHDPSLGRSLRAATYLCWVRISPDEARRGLEQLLAQERLEVTRQRKGKSKVRDVRPLLLEAQVLNSPPAEPLLPRSVGDRQVVRICTALPTSGGVRAQELLDLAFGPAAQEAWIVRTEVALAERP
jgi:radical SAM-linked protein